MGQPNQSGKSQDWGLIPDLGITVNPRQEKKKGYAHSKNICVALSV